MSDPRDTIDGLDATAEEFLALYNSDEAVEQRLLYGGNCFRVSEDGKVTLAPYRSESARDAR